MEIDNSNKIDNFNVGDEVIITGNTAVISEFKGKVGKIVKIYDDNTLKYPIIVKITETDSREVFRPDEIQLLKPTKDKQYSIFN